MHTQYLLSLQNNLLDLGAAISQPSLQSFGSHLVILNLNLDILRQESEYPHYRIVVQISYIIYINPGT
jgi:hypothetical protein